MIVANIKPGWISDESLHWVLVQNQSGELWNSSQNKQTPKITETCTARTHQHLLATAWEESSSSWRGCLDLARRAGGHLKHCDHGDRVDHRRVDHSQWRWREWVINIMLVLSLLSLTSWPLNMNHNHWRWIDDLFLRSPSEFGGSLADSDSLRSRESHRPKLSEACFDCPVIVMATII